MASLRQENDRGRKGWRLQFRDADKRNRTIWLGDVPEYTALETKAHVEYLLDAVKNNRPPENATADWLAKVDDELRNKLANCGLAESVAKRVARVLTLADWVHEYIAERKDVKQSTKESYEKARDNLIDFFGRKKLLRDITPAEGKRWRVWLKTEGNRRDNERKTMAEDTVRRRTATAKQFFREAVERGYMPADPFAKLPSAIQGNTKRQFFVEPHVIEACMEHCPCTDWKTILALARYGGLRIPSELVSLRWTDIDLPAGRMVIHASKTEHHSTGGVRVCPIFPELRPYLEAAWNEVPEGAKSEFVINRYRQSSQNLRQTFTVILKRAGIKPWPKLFQNLRASRETELMARFPAKDVAAWLGNSVPVAMKSYAMATDESFQAAADPNGMTVTTKAPSAQLDENGGCIGGCIPAVFGTIGKAGELSLNEKNPDKTGVFIVQDSAGGYWLMGDTGLESTSENGVFSGANRVDGVSAVASAVALRPVSPELLARIREWDPRVLGVGS